MCLLIERRDLNRLEAKRALPFGSSLDFCQFCRSLVSLRFVSSRFVSFWYPLVGGRCLGASYLVVSFGVIIEFGVIVYGALFAM